MKHLRRGGSLWCPSQPERTDSTTSPREATCTSCLRAAAEYGAASAMQCAVVESKSNENPELVRERDDALRQINLVNKLLEAQGCFVCVGCQELKRSSDRGAQIGTMSWCNRCAPHSSQLA